MPALHFSLLLRAWRARLELLKMAALVVKNTLLLYSLADNVLRRQEITMHRQRQVLDVKSLQVLKHSCLSMQPRHNQGCSRDH